MVGLVKKTKPAKSTLTTTKCSFLKDWQKKERNRNGSFLGCPKDTKDKVNPYAKSLPYFR